MSTVRYLEQDFMLLELHNLMICSNKLHNRYVKTAKPTNRRDIAIVAESRWNKRNKIKEVLSIASVSLEFNPCHSSLT